APTALAILVLYAVASRTQVGYWKDSVTLWEHTLQVTTANPFAHYNLAAELQAQKRFNEAVPHYLEAARIDPIYSRGAADLLIHLGNASFAQRQFGVAIDGYSAALRLDPNAA